jgi:hypothetical protein
MGAKKVTVRDCAGCRDDFYNRNRMGANESSGEPRCWSLTSAVFELKRDVPIDLPPPYNHIKPTRRPNCYRAPRYVRMKP